MFEIFQKLDPEDTLKKHMNMLLCENPGIDCRMLTCHDCPSTEPLVQYLTEKLNSAVVEEVSYKNWVTVDRTNLVLVTNSSQDFVETYVEKVNNLIRHDFVSKTQADESEKQRRNLQPGEAIVHLDFSENYSHIAQDSVQSAYFSQTQSTIHPVVVYYLDKDLIPQHKSLVFISPSTDHNSQFVRALQLKLVPYLKELVPGLKLIRYWSDGSGSQYKNKVNFFYLSRHYEKFSIHAEWYFFATSHGKGPVDGIGGTTKRMFRQESLTGRTALNDAKDLFEWMNRKDCNTKIVPMYLDLVDIKFVKVPTKLDPIHGTRSFHVVKCGEEPHSLRLFEVALSEEYLEVVL